VPLLLDPQGRVLAGESVNPLDALVDRICREHPYLNPEWVRQRAITQFPFLDPEASQRLPAWRAVYSYVTAVPDVMYPPDPAVVRAIRTEFDPKVVPLFVKRIYKATTGHLAGFGFHAIGSFLPNPKDSAPAPWTSRVMIPTHGPIVRVTQIDLHLEDRAERATRGLPGAYRAFDWRLYKTLRGRYQEWTGKQKAQWLEENDDVARRAAARAAAETRAQEREQKEASWLRSKLSNFDKDDARRLLALEEQARQGGE
jgi:hypothetical protein